MVTNSEGRAFSPLYLSAKESLTAHYILCHLGNIKRQRSDHMCTSLPAGSAFIYLITKHSLGS